MTVLKWYADTSFSIEKNYKDGSYTATQDGVMQLTENVCVAPKELGTYKDRRKAKRAINKYIARTRKVIKGKLYDESVVKRKRQVDFQVH